MDTTEEIDQDSELQNSGTPVEQKRCEQCGHRKLLTEFHRRRNKTDNRMRICADCYMDNLHETQRLQKEREQQWAKQEQERQERNEREAQERSERNERQAAEDLEKSLQANKRCPRCNQLRTDGHVWPDGRIFFSRYCETCVNDTPHTIYRMICPLIKAERYIGITTQSLNKRLSQHMQGGQSGTEYKQYWIDDLRHRGLKPIIEVVSEAPNEREAKLEELRYIYHSLQQGHPLVNGEATSPQLVLFLQNSTTNWLEASEEDIRATWIYNEQAKLWSMGWGIYRKSLWLHRNEMVYLMQNGRSPYLWLQDGLALNRMKAEYEKTYPTIVAHTELPTNLKERESILSKATIVRLRAYTDSIQNSLIEHDCTFLLSCNTPIQVEDYTKDPPALGSLKAVDHPQRRGEQVKRGEHGKLIIHPFSYCVPHEHAITMS